MRYMEPHLVNQMNDDTLDGSKVEEAWEKACDAYHDSLLLLEKTLPESVSTYLSNVSLHDAELTGKRPGGFFFTDYGHGDTLQLFCRQDGDDKALYVLEYQLEDSLEVENHWGPGFLDEGEDFWLYDEIGVDEMGRYTHNVLFSTGLELKIVFKKFSWLRAAIGEEH